MVIPPEYWDGAVDAVSILRFRFTGLFYSQLGFLERVSRGLG